MEPIKYKGIDITLDNAGEFAATVNTVRIRKPSLAAMKKHIDKTEKDKFEPFTVLVEERHSWRFNITPNVKGTNLARATCVGYGTNGRHRYRRKTFEIDIKGIITEVEHAYRDCPEVIEHFKKMKKLEEEKKKFEKTHEEKEKKLNEQLDLDSFRINTEI